MTAVSVGLASFWCVMELPSIIVGDRVVCGPTVRRCVAAVGRLSGRVLISSRGLARGPLSRPVGRHGTG